jgi:CSLREA domain-containing protein/uncharacterized repeat protein (TIGR02543 family)
VEVTGPNGSATIGGLATGEGNIIAFNGQGGVAIDSTSANIPILSNSIFANGGLGIDLAADGITFNDPGDTDTGANDQQNFPVLTSVWGDSNNIYIQGTLDSATAGTYKVELFANDQCDESNHGEGQTLVSTEDMMADSSGVTSFEFTLAGALPRDTLVTASATDPDNNTSEFSECSLYLSEPPAAATLISPNGRIFVDTPTYEWNVVHDATRYYLSVDGLSGNVFTNQYESSEVCDDTTCQVTVNNALDEGDYTWSVQTWNVIGVGPSSEMLFTVDIPSSTLLSPSGTITDSSFPIFAWTHFDAATSYMLWVDGEYWTVIAEWYQAADICFYEGACMIPSPRPLGNGDYTWKIQIAGNELPPDSWSDTGTFTMALPVPDPPVLVSPEGTIATAHPTYVWNVAADDDQYHLSVDGPGGNVFSAWYEAYSICPFDGVCYAAGPTELPNGEYSWRVQTSNELGVGPWSPDMNFVVSALPAPTLIAPTGIVSTTTPEFSWEEVVGAANYLLRVELQSGGTVATRSYSAIDVCEAGTCTVIPSLLLDTGGYRWKLTARDDLYNGGLSGEMTFSVELPVPGVATPISPAGTIGNTTPTYTWTDVVGATQYFLQVDNASESLVTEWHDASSICSSGLCSVTPATTLEYGNYTWKVQAANSTGTGPWSAETAFSVESLLIIVNTTDDADDGICNSSHCSLREAINLSNVDPTRAVITFDIPGPAPHRIQPTSELPAITDPVVIDGTSEPDYAGAPVIELEGSAVATAVNGLTITGGDSVIRGITIYGFGENGIYISDGDNNIIEGNYIGTDPSGALGVGNADNGIYIFGSSDNVVGGTVAAARNVISGNGYRGIYIYGNSGSTRSWNNVIQGNFIGTDGTGTVRVANGDGIGITGTRYTTIGGTDSGARNVISGNSSHGIDFLSTYGTVIQGNYIGVDVTGNSALGNNRIGIYVRGNNVTIGGSMSGAGNVISANSHYGVSLSGGYGSPARVQGNLIGTNASGTAALGNHYDGIIVSGDWNTIGGTTSETRNVISGNLERGISLRGSTNSVQGNYIGTDITGMIGLGNAQEGISISDAGNRIGGTAEGDRNVIAANGSHGVYLRNSGTVSNLVQGNYIGTDRTGSGSLGNNGHGIYMSHGASNNSIGGLSAATGNIVAFNSYDGVSIMLSGNNNRIGSNSIAFNGASGIDLGNDDVTINDFRDADTGINNLQNFPILTSAFTDGAGGLVEGTFNSTPDTTFRVEFFTNTTCDPSGHGEGESFLGFVDVTTDANGNASLSYSHGASIPAGYFMDGGGATTDPQPNCNGGTQYWEGTVVQLTATANTGYAFFNWSGDASGTDNPVSVTMDADKSVTANFSDVCYTLTTAASPPEGGGVSADPPPNCNNGTQYTPGTVVDLTATPNSGYTFNSWTRDVTDTANPVSVTMDGDKTVTANFDLICFTLMLSVEPVFGGSVSASPPPDCNNGTQYTQGAMVALTAAANTGYAFNSWAGDITDTANPASVTMDADKQVAASLDLMPGWSPLPVKDIAVELSGTAPTTAVVNIDGTLRDSCTEFSHALQVRNGNHVEVQVLTSRPLDVLCTATESPFSTSVPLEGDFPPDHYTLSVNGMVEHFGMP